MNIFQAVVTSSLFILISSTVTAGVLTIPNTFQAGQPAFAADVNANFDATKAAVDDNDTRISALANGGSGAIAVHANGFHVPANQVGCAEDNSSYLFMSAGTKCNGYANIQIPDGASINGLGCTVQDSSATAGADLYVTLIRTSGVAVTVTHQVVMRTSTSITTATTGSQYISTSTLETAGSDTVNNTLYYYKLDANFGTGNGGSSVKLYGCTVTYN